MTSRRSRKRKLIRRVLLLVIFAFSVCGGVGGMALYTSITTAKQVDGVIASVQEDAAVRDDTSSAKLTDQSKVPTTNNPYWDFIKLSLKDVNLTKLRQRNPDTVGWLQVQGINVNYPFVQTSDNSYYLSRDFDGAPSSAGWVFLDYRNTKDLTDYNNILYAHGRLEGTMFGSLRELLDGTWIDYPENSVIFTSTEVSNAMWQVFSVYRTPVTDSYLAKGFASAEEFEPFVQALKAKSAHDFGLPVTGADKILTLSTCYDDDERLVVHAKLIKYN